ncbi:hypothetical protein [Pseudoalteromonas sp. BDTF-M6]|uniref:hypothetical protein n=1 Tax=Pseudoalteromonas sp. BDTF-M6 TaxID=2796132 RepID=UPI001BAEA9BD|nr:hypothetical protein [Pseudoalteromonas sp. BDTF-M6]MBS3796689.1 hypothetical protein [Pseudoalteromonas sp. BDTF-M6]
MTSQEMTFDEIKRELNERKVLFSDIAEAMKVKPSHVSNVARGLVSSFRIATALALSLDKPITEVFGDKYANPGKRGPKDRSERKRQVIEALTNNKPVPAPTTIS